MTSYKRVVIEQHSESHEALQVREEHELPKVGPGQARLKVLCASASFTDLMIRAGKYMGVPKPSAEQPLTLGYDLVGVVEEVGEGVTSVAVGDRVAALTVWGAFTQQAVLDVQHLVPVPEGLSSEDAVSLVLAWLTSYQMLTRCGFTPAEGKTALVHGASGSCGVALTRLAKTYGMRVIGTASARKHDFCREQGVDVCVDYRKEDFVQVAKEEQLVDVVFDAVGFENFQRSLECLKPEGGSLVTYGFYSQSLEGSTAGFLAEFVKFKAWSSWKSWRTNHSIEFYIITEMRKEHPEWFQEDLRTLFSLCLEGKIKPHIHKLMRLEEAAEAQRMIAEHEVEGKIVLQIQKSE